MTWVSLFQGTAWGAFTGKFEFYPLPLFASFSAKLAPKTPKRQLQTPKPALFHAQYDWTTGVPDNGDEWRKFRVIPCRRAFRLPGEGGIVSIVRWNLRPVIFGAEL